MLCTLNTLGTIYSHHRCPWKIYTIYSAALLLLSAIYVCVRVYAQCDDMENEKAVFNSSYSYVALSFCPKQLTRRKHTRNVLTEEKLGDTWKECGNSSLWALWKSLVQEYCAHDANELCLFHNGQSYSNRPIHEIKLKLLPVQCANYRATL